MTFDTEDQARKFVLDRQLAHKNLRGLGLQYVRGARYNMERAPGKRTDLTSPQVEGGFSDQTPEARFECSHATIEREGRIARTIDELARVHGHVVRGFLLDPGNGVTAQNVKRLAALPLTDQDEAVAALSDGCIHPSLQRQKKPTGAPAQPAQPNLASSAPTDALGAAVDALVRGMEDVERAATELRESDPQAYTSLTQAANSLGHRYSAFASKLDALCTAPDGDLPVVETDHARPSDKGTNRLPRSSRDSAG